MTKEVLSGAAIVLTFLVFFPYVRSILLKQTKPHVFSWIIWGLGTAVVFFAQLAGQAGVGAWPIGISATITFLVAWLAYWQRGDMEITRVDWLFFAAALSALPLWFVTADPLWAVVVLTLVDLLGFGPTLRKALIDPHQESALFFALAALRNLLVILALEHYSLTTYLFPGAVGVACLALAIFLLTRRRLVPGLPTH